MFYETEIEPTFTFFMTSIVKIVLLIVFSVPFSAKGQHRTVAVQYSFLTNGNRSQWKLEICGEQSFFERIKEHETLSADPNPKVMLKSTGTYFFVKNKKEQSLRYTEIINRKTFFVLDSLHPMKWRLQQTQKKILGFNCNAATTVFRGRYFTAYYCPTLPVPDGPFKFGGLPGLILEVVSDDFEHIYRAESINTFEPACLSQNFEKRKSESFIDFSDFGPLFIEEINAAVKKMKTQASQDDTGEPMFFKYNRLEIIYKEAQIGDGIEF